MSTLTLAMASPKSLKRSYDETGLEDPLHISSTSPNQAPVSSVTSTQDRQSSPFPAISGTTTDRTLRNDPVRVAADKDGPPSSLPASSIKQSSAKKAKLTFEEREVRRIEKEFKAREKAEEKAKKEEEKAKKEHEKVKKDEEKKAKEVMKEEKRKAREQLANAKQEEKRLKEEAKQKQEEEKNRKSRACNQLRLNAFFTQPSMPNGTSSGSPTRDAHSPLSSRRSSISEIQAMESSRRSRSVSSTPQKAKVSDYEREFKPFYTPSNTNLALYNRFARDSVGLSLLRDMVDEGLAIKLEPPEMTEVASRSSIIELLKLPPHKLRQRSPQVLAVKDIMEEIEGTTSRPIDLTGPQLKRNTKNPLHLLKNVSMKYLKFAEDVRPPYIGTYTRLQGSQSISRLARNPFGHGLPDTNYEYDSEAEWEEPAEGEDLDSEGEEEADDEDDEDEMAGFLDDEGASDLVRAVKRRPVLGSQQPTCTGMCWEGQQGQLFDQGLAALDWRLLKLDILMENPQLPIDPYCSSYWLPKASTTVLQTTPHAQSNLMEPPRLPLHPVIRQVLSSSSLAKPPDDSASNPPGPRKPAKVHRQIAPELMDDFKAEVQGNDLTKVGLLEILKKKFPKQSKDAIKDTLETIAERVGPKPTEKKWMLKSGI